MSSKLLAGGCAGVAQSNGDGVAAGLTGSGTSSNELFDGGML